MQLKTVDARHFKGDGGEVVLETAVCQVKRFGNRYIYNLCLKVESKLKCPMSQFYSFHLLKHSHTFLVVIAI